MSNLASDRLADRLGRSDIVDADLVAAAIRDAIDERAITIVQAVVGGEFERIVEIAKCSTDGDRTPTLADRRRSGHAASEAECKHPACTARRNANAAREDAAAQRDDPAVAPAEFVGTDREFAAYKRGRADAQADRFVFTSYDRDAVADAIRKLGTYSGTVESLAHEICRSIAASRRAAAAAAKRA